MLGATLALLPYGPARAAGISLIRDAEIEATLQQMAGPILDAAGLGREAVRIYIVNDNQLNAFVAGGMNLFLNTGLIMRTENAGQLAGVMAHETGHIAGGHLSRVGGAQRRAAAEMILATVLGAAAMVAAPPLGAAIITGGQSYAQNNLMRFSRGQEQAADQAGVGYLERSGISAAGLAEFFHVLDSQNVLAVSRMSPYLQTHPLTRDRIQVRREPGRGGGRAFPRIASRLGIGAWPHGRQAAGVPARSARGPAALQDERHAARPVCQNDRPLPAAGPARSARGHRCADRRRSGRSLFSRAEGPDAVRERPHRRSDRALSQGGGAAPGLPAAQGRSRPGYDRERGAAAPMPSRSLTWRKRWRASRPTPARGVCSASRKAGTAWRASPICRSPSMPS